MTTTLDLLHDQLCTLSIDYDAAYTNQDYNLATDLSDQMAELEQAINTLTSEAV